MKNYKCNIEPLLYGFKVNDANFARRLYATKWEKYRSRISRFQLNSNAKVLDAGCGFGQWTICFSEICEYVEACEIEEDRVTFCENIAKELGRENINFLKASTEDLPYKSNSFDFIFSYGVIFLSDWKKSLRELIRVCTPGGEIYLTLNDLGWYVYLWESEHNKDELYDPKGDVPHILLNTLKHDRNKSHQIGKYKHSIITPNALKNELEIIGNCKLIYTGEEGSYSKERNSKKDSFFIGSYKGLNACYDAVIIKL